MILRVSLVVFESSGLRKMDSFLHLSLLLQLALWETAEAMHPDCALVVQHMKAQEECYHILEQEENNHSLKTGWCIVVLLWGNTEGLQK
ncbi:hypothetical protein GOODEAATRI_026330 [Goodea atripinnis]|uniref:Uncharacterized protein n=1 Tax=Goodea atripinnis TaxID=208336 RepID=A0ABV0PH70_9TELE